jgi:hypothetical protein
MRFTMLVPTLILGSVFLTVSVRAQSPSIHRPLGPGATLEVLVPQWKGDASTERSGLAAIATLRWRAGENTVMLITLPYVRYRERFSYSYPPFSFESTSQEDGLGNVGFGFITSPNANLAFEGLITVPTISEHKGSLTVAGLLSDFDRFSAYAPKNLSLAFHANALTNDESLLVGRFRVGPTVWIITEGAADKKFHASIDASLGLGFRAGPVEAGVLGTTRTIVSDERFFTEKTVVHLALTAAVQLESFQFQAFYRLPQDETIKSTLDGTLGLAISYLL